MKKRFIVLLLALLFCFTLTGCIGTYNPATGGGRPSQGGETGDNEPVKGGLTFTVTLVLNNERFIPDEAITARWSNDESLFTADFVGSEASATGLDGNYRVMLSKVPEGYVYDPNAYVATNKDRDIIIELYELNVTRSSGTGWDSNSLISINNYNELGGANNGYYGINFTERNQKVYIRFSSMKKGRYSIESIMDTTANNVNPRLDYYGSNSQFQLESPIDTCNTGGVSSTYTKNFKYDISLDSDVANLVLRCDSRIGYPVTVYFKITWMDEYSRDYVFDLKIPEQLYDESGAVIKSPDGTGTYVKYGNESGNANHVLYGDRAERHDDGYWYNKEDGSLIYANLSEITMGREQTSEGPDGTTTTYDLRIPIEPYDYIYFVMGWQALDSVYGERMPENYKQYENGEGYAASANSDGRVAVTDELKDFLLAYCRWQRFFFDGYGVHEGGANGYNSSDDDQWMYFCGYYAK